MSATTRSVTVADTRFVVRDEGSGDGTPVLLLHGVPETSAAWRHLQPRLAQARRVLAPDLPGLGGSAYTGPYDARSVTEEVLALLDAELPGQRVDVVGHDWGGVVALGLAGLHGDRVRRLVVSNTAYRQVPLRAVHVPFFALPVAPELLFRLGGPRVVETMLGLGWKAATPLEPEVLAEYVAAYTDGERVRAMLGYYRAAARPRVRALLPGGGSPVGLPRVAPPERALVVWGARDPVLPVSVGEGIVRDLGATATMTTVPGAGHFVHEEAPQVFGDVVEAFLAEPLTTPGAPPPVPAEDASPAPRRRGRTSAG